jgi:hypothetical protein
MRRSASSFWGDLGFVRARTPARVYARAWLVQEPPEEQCDDKQGCDYPKPEGYLAASRRHAVA